MLSFLDMTELEKYLEKKKIKKRIFIKQVLAITPPKVRLNRTQIRCVCRGDRYPSTIAAYWIARATNFEVRPIDLLYPIERIVQFEKEFNSEVALKGTSEVNPAGCSDPAGS